MGLEPLWKKSKTKSQRQEERNARLPQGGKQRNSGRGPYSRRDNTLERFLIESRTTSRGSYSINAAEFYDIKRQGAIQPPGYLAAMQIDFEENGLSILAVELDDMISILEELRELRESRTGS